MANEVVDAFNTVYPDGPSSAPYEPKKSEIRGIIGPVIQGLFDQLFALIGVGFQLKTEVRAASTTNVPLASMSNGASFGGVTLATGQRFAPIGQTNQAENGIYVAQASGAPVRATDADAAGEIRSMSFFVSEGTHAGKVFACAEAGVIVVGTTPLPFRLLLDMSSLNAAIAAKASQAALDALALIVAGKASQLQVDELFGSGLLDIDYADAFHDGSNNILIGFRHDGTVDVLDTYPLLDDEFRYAVADPSGNVIWGIKHDDTFYPSNGAVVDDDGDTIAFARDGQIIVYRDGVRAPITFSGYQASPSVSGDRVTYLKDTGTAVLRRVEEIRGTTSLDGAVTAVVHYILYGQSLSEGVEGSPSVHTTAVRAGRAVMYNSGVRVRGGAAANIIVPPENLFALVDLLESDMESPGPGIGWAATAAGRLPSTSAALLSAHGMGGATYADLAKGSVMYANLLEAVRRARVISSLNEVDYTVGAVSWIHGEANRTDSKAVYKAYLLELQTDLTADLNALSDDTGQVLLCVDQLANWTAYGDSASEVPFAQLEAAIENPTKIICVGPKYMLPTVADGKHLTAAAYARLGSYHGRAIEQHRSGTPWKPLYCTGASRTGAVITLTFNVPVGPLVFDTTAVSNPGNYGFTWSQTGGTARTISSVAIVGSTVQITLSGDPGSPSASSVGIAATGSPGANGGPTTGPRCCLRDSAADLDIDGNAMPNWACNQIITL